jgi:RNase P/RNase MRP subunit p29
MKKVLVLVCAFVFIAVVAFAAGPKTYQVTGPVVEVTDTMIVVTKGKDNWQLARDANTRVTGDLKVGAKVTIDYTMTAASVEVKETKKKSKSK